VPVRFRNRATAGEALGRRLADTPGLAGATDVVVLGLPRGGVAVAAEVARILDAALDVVVVRKLGVPGHVELAMGAIGPGGVRFLNDDVVIGLDIGPGVVDAVTRREQQELERREALYRGDRVPVGIAGRRAVVVDDGLATGSTMHAAVRAVRRQQPSTVVVAVPAGAPEAVAALADEADAVIALATPHPFGAVGIWYDDFSQTTDDEVRALLARA
jgi:predicted phosphoribosyltransferase